MKKDFFLLFFLFYLSISIAQDNTNSFFGSIGLFTFSGNSESEAPKLYNWSIGYQKKIWNERTRLVPSLSFGNYRGGFLSQGPPDAFYSSTNLNLALEYDFFKMNRRSIFLGLGIYANNSRGYVGPYETHGGEFYFKGNFSSSDVGLNLKLGYRNNQYSNALGYEILVCNSNIGFFNSHLEIAIIRIRLLINTNPNKAKSKGNSS